MPEEREKTPTLDYEPPERLRPAKRPMRRDVSLDYLLLCTVVVLLLLGAALFAVSGISMIHSPRGKGTAAREDARNDGARMLLISGVLLLPGLWYGRIALRGPSAIG